MTEEEAESTILQIENQGLKNLLAALRDDHEKIKREVEVAFRNAARVMHDWAAKSTYSLIDIVAELNNLFQQSLKLQHRLKEVTEERDIAENKKYQRLAGSHAQLSERFDRMQAKLQDEIANHQHAASVANAESKRKDEIIEGIMRRKEEQARLSREVLRMFVNRPARLMEIWGEDGYQKAKDAFILLGGDESDLHPPSSLD